jgi:hypothetical protein
LMNRHCSPTHTWLVLAVLSHLCHTVTPARRRDVGETCVVGYFEQHPPPVRDDLRIIDYIR